MLAFVFKLFMCTGEPRPLDVVVLLYRNAPLAVALCRSLQAIEDELTAENSSVFAIDDSSDDAALQSALRRAAERFRIPFEIATNESNLGFVASANLGLRRAVARRHDALLLNSDTLVFPGAITEMRRVAALDPMIGFVNPRSNNASICSLPQQEELRKKDPSACHADFLKRAPHLPDFQFVPTAVGFCLLIKFEVLAEFGFLDEAYSPGYSEENDLVMRANRCGYRAALANRAFVYHSGSASFNNAVRRTHLQASNTETLCSRYPEYAAAVDQYGSGPQYQGERLLGALLPDAQGRLDVLFDFSSIGPSHNGTFDAGTKILQHATREWRPFFKVHVMASDAARRFHGLDDIPGLSFATAGTNQTFAAAFRFGQPFRLDHLISMARIAAVNVYAMLDPISYDCLHLNEADLGVIWASVFAHADGVMYISDTVAEQFRRRFRRREGLGELVCPLSLDLRDYAAAGPRASIPGEHILIIGNSFAHKHVKPTVAALREAFPALPIAALGLEAADLPGVTAWPSGEIPRAQVDDLFRRAKCVVFPSLYEGFGMPVLEALAHGKPVLARNIPVTREIGQKCSAGENLIFYHSTADLIALLREGMPEWHDSCPGLPHPVHGWADVASQLGGFLRERIEKVSYQNVILPRLEHLWALECMTGAGQAASAANRASSLVRALYDRDVQIAALRNSLSWKITAPLRGLGSLYLRLTRRA